MAPAREVPGSGEDAARLLASCAREGLVVRARGGGTKADWAEVPGQVDVELSTLALDQVLEHNEGDLTAVLQAGVPLAAAQRRFAAAGQMLALDPPLGADDGATIGGVMATGDSGPRRHRYGAPRDLVLGAAVALADGTLARSGGKVIKNVAGYDLAKLFCGSLGTLGVIAEVAVRLHPLPERTATVVVESPDPERLARAAMLLSHASLELECLDVRWGSGQGAVLARFAGRSAPLQATRAAELLAGSALEAAVVEADDEIWARQRAGQRSEGEAVVRVSAVQSALATLLGWVEARRASLVGRAGLGVSWVTLDAVDPKRTVAAIGDLRRALAPAACVLLDGPAGVRDLVDRWGALHPGTLSLSERLKARFDPAGTCNPGVFAGGI